jgi:hypothetical protein
VVAVAVSCEGHPVVALRVPATALGVILAVLSVMIPMGNITDSSI